MKTTDRTTARVAAACPSRRIAAAEPAAALPPGTLLHRPSARMEAEAQLIHETSFFRDAAPFDLLRRGILPALIAAREPQQRLRFWSAASSTGQEAYSLLMLLAEHFPQTREWDVQVIGTDIAPRVRQYAELGVYTRLEVNRGMPARLLLKYFDRDGEFWQVKPELRRRASFRLANLCAPLPSLPAFDLVLLRNVLLYLPQPQRAALLANVRRRMRPDGALLLGHAEQADSATELFHTSLERDSFYYRCAA